MFGYSVVALLFQNRANYGINAYVLRPLARPSYNAGQILWQSRLGPDSGFQLQLAILRDWYGNIIRVATHANLITRFVEPTYTCHPSPLRVL